MWWTLPAAFPETLPPPAHGPPPIQETPHSEARQPLPAPPELSFETARAPQAGQPATRARLKLGLARAQPVPAPEVSWMFSAGQAMALSAQKGVHGSKGASRGQAMGEPEPAQPGPEWPIGMNRQAAEARSRQFLRESAYWQALCQRTADRQTDPRPGSAGFLRFSSHGTRSAAH